MLAFGQVGGPPPVGPPDALGVRTAPIGDPTHVPIMTLTRVGLTRHRLVELVELLQNALEEHDRRR